MQTLRLYNDLLFMILLEFFMSRIDLLGCPVDCLNFEDTVAYIERCIRERKPCQHVVLNVAKLVEARRNPDLYRIISNCDIINADGMPLVWASRLLKKPLKHRVTGIDLFYKLVKISAARGYRPFFFGAREKVVAKTVSVFKEMYPNLEIAGFRNGYFNENEESEIANMIRKSRADILFVGFSSPMKERFLNRWMPVMQVPFCMGVGGSFDIVAGVTRRAPQWMQKSGMEWLYRFLQEPRRMWKRYCITNSTFIWLVIKELICSSL